MCERVGLSRASYYRLWEQTAPAEAETELREAVQQAALAHRHYGYRRITAWLKRHQWEVGWRKVRRLMREDNLLAVAKRKFIPTTDSQHRFRVYPNLVEHLVIEDINQLWVADLTYIRLMEEFVYLAVVLDAFSRRVVGSALGRTLQASLPLAALNRALRQRQPGPGLVHHSDRGTQYACHKYVHRLEACQAVLSMSRPARPWENARCESFIRTLKKEALDGRGYRSLQELKDHLEEFIEQTYNRVRLHSALGYQSPEEFEQKLARHKPQSWSFPAALTFPRYEEVPFLEGG